MMPNEKTDEKDVVNTSDPAELKRRFEEALPGVEVSIDASATVGGTHFMDVRRNGKFMTIQVQTSPLTPVEYGLSLHDGSGDDVAFTGPDCVFRHAPTLVRYMAIFLGLNRDERFHVGDVVRHKTSRLICTVARFEHDGTTDFWADNETGPYKQFEFEKLAGK